MNFNAEHRGNLFGLSSAMASEFRRMEESRLDWLKHIKAADTIADAARTINASASSAFMSSLSPQPVIRKMSEQWKGEQEHMKRILDPIAGIHQHFAADERLKKLINQATEPFALSEQFANAFKQVSVDTSAWDVFEKSTLASINQAKGLLPREVVHPISENGKWIEIQYYDWLRQGYHTGWVLKKYFKRVPANHLQQSVVQVEQ